MVIPSLINKFNNFKQKKISIWGDGTNIRDFVYSKDVAKAMLHIMFKSPQFPINIGSGKGITIKKLVTKINNIYGNKKKINWDKSKIGGDKKRILNIDKLVKIGFNNFCSLDDALKETVDWYKLNLNKKIKKYNAFNEK